MAKDFGGIFLSTRENIALPARHSVLKCLLRFPDRFARFHGENAKDGNDGARSFHEREGITSARVMHEKSGALLSRGKGPAFLRVTRAYPPAVRDTETEHFYAREKTEVLYAAERPLRHRLCLSPRHHADAAESSPESRNSHGRTATAHCVVHG
jgi:hypothetical protein